VSSETTPATFPLVVVSNRLPVSFSVNDRGSKVPSLSPGGLVAAVAPALQGRNAAWVGWDGTSSPNEDPIHATGIMSFPVALEAEIVEAHYEGYSNSTLWPLFHDVGVGAHQKKEWWSAYRDVNRRFAERTASLVDEDGIVWVHDYQMMLVPGLLRDLMPNVRIGYFHHIPFCRAERFHTLANHPDIVASLNQADIVGFQREVDARNFEQSRVEIGTPRATIATYPISIDFDAVSDAAGDQEVVERARELRKEWGHPKTVFLGVDRIDYTKGIVERLEAFEYLLKTEALSVEEVVMVQAGSPSRENVESYQKLRQAVDSTVARINEAFPTVSGRSAVMYSAMNLDREELLALFVAADVMVVSSLRDGMNLVAKEFVACRNGASGVLILSPFTGAADHMREAILADPTDKEALVAAMSEATMMPADEQQRRMNALRDEVRRHDVSWWSGTILRDLGSVEQAS